MSELALIRAAQAGDREAADLLVRRYRNLAIAQIGGYYIRTGDRDDLEQEAVFALWRAIRYFHPDGPMDFPRYAAMAVRRWLAWVLRRENALKQQGLTWALREGVNEDGEPVAAVDLLPAHGNGDPERSLLNREELRRLGVGLATLTPLERRAVLGIAGGVPYSAIDGSARAVDNANQRARQKLREAA